MLCLITKAIINLNQLEYRKRNFFGRFEVQITVVETIVGRVMYKTSNQSSKLILLPPKMLLFV